MKIKLIISGVTMAAAALWGANASAAGVGGVAGSAAFNLDSSGNVTEATVAGAVGKDSAYAGSTAAGASGALESFALGTGGAITFTGTNAYITSVAEDPDTPPTTLTANAP